ncbi:S8 family serine peptidase [Ruegeria sp. 2205SS24-7]|uniref:S8 family peptidase n=1 Tax=Ruegeria discodermiae TaxID=3064389 RepID=UPI002740C647|nr:S8 family serine peptidase [Ruegeria sp. 2205SS24-7]MDP5217000.1 S8 family serine peptidase [Ruegeria sp. 2205SS24-7]
MRRSGHLQLKLRQGVETRAPAHLDVLDGARRASGSVDGSGDVDRAILRQTTGMRARRVFHAGAHVNRIGQRDADYNDLETKLGLSQVLCIELAEPVRADDVIKALRDADAVDWVRAEPLSSVPPMHEDRDHNADPRAPFDHVGALAALAIEPGSHAITVAVIDTGVALEHEEFSGRLVAGYDTVDLGMGQISEGVSLVGDSLGRDFCARDETGHGSHVAGIIGARGLSMTHGVGGQSRIVPVRALAAARAGEGPVFGVGGLSDIDAAIKAAVDLGAKVLNMSFGTARDDLDPLAPPPHTDAIAYATARNAIPVAAMGNSGLSEEYFPAALPQCIAVGSMALDGRVSDFSTKGPHIALCAPGEAVHSTKLHGYGRSTGTSHAAPFVSGAAALLAARARRRGHDLTTEEARQALCYSAENHGRQPDEDTGWGMLNIPAALSRLDTIIPAYEEVSP